MASLPARSLSLLAAAVLALAPSARAADAPEDIRFKVEKLLEGMPQPMHLEFGPDGRIWLNEYTGARKVYDPKTKRVTLVAEIEAFKQQ